MSDDADTATRYRQRAEELRVIADTGCSSSMRETLIKVADEWDRMAKSAEARDKVNDFVANRG